MTRKSNFDVELARIEALRDLSPEAAEPELANALALRNNLLVAKAAKIALHHRCTGLAKNLAEAFHRFLEDGGKTDPQCWAKDAIAKALAEFGYQDAELFLAGMRHIQLGGSWGGASDAAGTLRGTCALALVQCRDLSSHQVLLHLTPLFADRELSVRVDAARAVEQIGTDSSALLLRLRAELASDEAELLGVCYSGVLALEGRGALPWAAKFLRQQDRASAEAAIAIALTHTAEAFELLQTAFESSFHSEFRSDLLSAIALIRHQPATDWLLALIEAKHSYASEAHDAICRSAPSTQTKERLERLGKPCR
jgi:hypothetical protein